MKLTPIDIRKQEFKKVMRGYDPVEVDTFMDMVANEFESLLREHKDIRDRTVETETQLKDYRQIEKALQQTLLQAQETTGKSYESARKEAELILREADMKGAKIVEQANADLVRMTRELHELQGRREAFLAKLRLLLSAELDLLKVFDTGSEPPAPQPPQPPARDTIALDDILRDIDDDRIAKAH
jgi:cell division initiation protein